MATVRLVYKEKEQFNRQEFQNALQTAFKAREINFMTLKEDRLCVELKGDIPTQVDEIRGLFQRMPYNKATLEAIGDQNFV